MLLCVQMGLKVNLGDGSQDWEFDRMGTIYLVRHGQASFGADDYDQLSDLGRRQSVRLGEYFLEKGIHFDVLMAGTLRRHKQTMEGILQGLARQHEHLSWEGP